MLKLGFKLIGKIFSLFDENCLNASSVVSVILAPSAADTSRKHSFLLRKTLNIIRLKLSGDVDFFLLSVEGTQVIRIRSHPHLFRENYSSTVFPFVFLYIHQKKKKVFLYLKLCFKTLIYSDL